ncbi:GntR family transcriptional regulator [Streptomyces sp. S1A1-8]|uniref:GntR family transcriptional regulator n=1 Tax=unclassified Streptomyces TaxID=2593676 RepID=UPI0011654E5C|nr:MULTISPECIES: GntR family transcriptional regulator [unclassified Streptomyces]QDO25654.1 GntR family transcriptional regulator [Streptomyces sp. S1A1-8]QDO35771.1 GntR family transcriptional regulator [Streptomyces sp. S1A1-3]
MAARLPLEGERRSLREIAYASIRRAIIELRLPPGEFITEESLSAELGVSRPVLRESVQRLQAEGLLERAGNGRVRVRGVSAEEVQDLYAVRSALEQLSVEQAVGRVTSGVLAELREALERMRTAAARGAPGKITDAGSDFHAILRRVAGNPVNDQMMHMVGGRIDRYRNLSVSLTARPDHSLAEHDAILTALAEGDVTAAKRAMGDHIMAGRDAVLVAVESLRATGEPVDGP